MAENLNDYREKDLKILRPNFFEKDPLELAPEILGSLFIIEKKTYKLIARIVEVEAYRGHLDEASHAYSGKTKRNEAMFGPPGHLYVYFTYGMHYCANIVCAPEGTAGALLIRAAIPIEGINHMRRRRQARIRRLDDKDLLRGPARFCQGLGIDGKMNKLVLSKDKTHAYLAKDSVRLDGEIENSPRIGIKKAIHHNWRFFVRNCPYVSR